MPIYDGQGRPMRPGGAKAAGERLAHDGVNRVMRAVTLEGQRRIMEKTPVDTGRARANWNTTAGEADVATDEGLTSADVASKQSAGAGTISKHDFTKGESIFVANGLPYIEELENGSSKQAPNGMVELTLAELAPVLDAAAAQVSRE